MTLQPDSTARTVASRTFTTEVRKLAPSVRVTEVAAALLAPVFAQFGSVNADVTAAADTRTGIFAPPRSAEDFQMLVIAVEQWLRGKDTSQMRMSRADVGDAIRECIARGELERAAGLLRAAGGKLRSTAELRYLDRVWTQASGNPKP